MVFKGLIIKYHAFFGGPVFCDLQSLLYTTTDLPFERLYVEAVRYSWLRFVHPTSLRTPFSLRSVRRSTPSTT